MQHSCMYAEHSCMYAEHSCMYAEHSCIYALKKKVVKHRLIFKNMYACIEFFRKMYACILIIYACIHHVCMHSYLSMLSIHFNLCMHRYSN